MFDLDQDQLSFVLPASQVTQQETGILWYEVTSVKSQSRSRIVAFDGTSLKKVSQVETVMMGETNSRTVLTEGDVELVAEVSAQGVTDENPTIQLKVNGYEVDLQSLDGGMNNQADSAGRLNESEVRVVSHWSRIFESLEMMVMVLKAHSPTDNPSCHVCHLWAEHVTLEIRACYGSLHACPDAIADMQHYVHDCTGACH